MSKKNFVDYIKIYCRSGKGGAGSAHFRRERYIPKGGPDGGDGGKGGSIIVKGNSHMWTLLHLKFTRHVIAGSGEQGGANQRFGASGKDVIIEVPLGTIIIDAETGEKVCEVSEHDEKYVILEGGKGGLGNVHFKSSVNQAPKYAQPGEPAQEKYFIFELKLLADVGLVGFPNAGKSTLLSVVSAAKPEIADYPFTTLKPNLGLVRVHENQSFVMADIPGIIEGASEGKGLGLRFLRHIERNALLLFMVSVESDNIRKDYETLLNELQTYSPELMDKQRILAITKMDILGEEYIEELKKDLPDIPYVFISSVTGKNIQKLKEMIWEEL